MKTHKGLYPQICSFENLYLAARKAQKGKRFKTNTARFNVELEKELLRLREELTSKTYVPGPYAEFFIHEPKRRMISAAPYRDRVVHHALCNVIVPIFERTFIHDSYANRIGKGTHRAVLRFQEFMRRNEYVLKCDLRKYFPSIDHEVLKAEIRRKIGCRDTLWLADTIIDGSNPQEPVAIYFPGDDLFTPFDRRKGLPIGNLTSQFFANVYLNRFDHFVKETLGCRYYIRYVDDFVALSSDKRFLHEVADAMKEYLSTLRLAIHPNKCHIFRADVGIDFLGYQVFRDHRLLRKSNVVRFRRKLRRMVGAYSEGTMSWEEIDRSVQSWLGHAKFADTWGLRRRIFGGCAFVKG